MKKINLIFIFIFIIGCNSNLPSKPKQSSITCPSILFASNHRNYIGIPRDNPTFDNILYQAQINNAKFTSKCNVDNNQFIAELSILFIISPLKNDYNLIEMPFYIAILNQEKELKDILYFSVQGNITKNFETKKLVETDLTEKINIYNKSINDKSIIVIGFIIDKNKKIFLN